MKLGGSLANEVQKFGRQRGEEEVHLQRGAVWQLELGSVWGDSEVGDFGALEVEFVGDLGARLWAWRLGMRIPTDRKKKREARGLFLSWVGRAGPVGYQSSLFC
jgi:hypothetical protein